MNKVTYYVSDCKFGKIIVGFDNNKHVNFISLGKNQSQLTTKLEKTFRNCQITRIEPDKKTQNILERFFNGEQSLSDLKIKPQGTDFMRSVWHEMTKIPYGKTISYSSLANKCGNPKAVRAVGSACAHNPILFAIPCHRVVRSDNSLGGFSAEGGISLKQKLLDLEAAN